MAVSGKTAAPHEIPYFLGTDKPPDMAAVTKAIADRLQLRLPIALQVGGEGSLLFGTGATTARISTGVYKITLAKEAGSVVIATPSLAGGTTGNPVKIRSANASKTSVEILIENAAEVAVNSPFNVVIQPS
jgi:hypothetical protein